MAQVVNLIHPGTESKITGTFTEEEYALYLSEGYEEGTDETPTEQDTSLEP
jgi:hypothetical protein